MSCGDLCTAVKCQELEARIGALEQALELLEASFEAHTQQSIPEAHQYQPEITVNTTIDAGEFITDVTIDGQNDFSAVPLPDSLVPSVTMDIFEPTPGEYIFKVGVNGVFDEDTFNLPQLDVAIDTFETDPNIYTLVVQVGEERDETILPSSNIQSNLKIDGSFQNDSLLLSISDGVSQDTAEIPIYLNDDQSQNINSNLRISGSFRNDILTLTVADGQSIDSDQIFIDTNSNPQTIFITEEVYMNCDELENKIDDCCALLVNEINNSRNIIIAELEETENNLKNDIDSAENIINNNLRDVTDKVEIIDAAVTVDISGTVNTEYFCQFPLTEDLTPIPDYAESITKEAQYMGSGLVGLHENLKLINANLDSIHSDICKAVDPRSRLTSDDLYRFCNNSDIERSDYAEGTAGDEQYAEAIQAYLTDLIDDSKYGYLLNFLNEETGNLLINAPNNWITPMLADFSLIQSRINNAAICNIEPSENGDVVAIVASDKVLDRATGKLLVLHLVTFENYPKRLRNSTYWQVQIPQAKETYDWDEDFKDLVWHRGNLYAEMYFDGIKDPISGFFVDKGAADSWFNSILPLTTAIERNRKYHEQKTPNRNITLNITRPYRAFITSVNDVGRAVCEIKFVPPTNNNET